MSSETKPVPDHDEFTTLEVLLIPPGTSLRLKGVRTAYALVDDGLVSVEYLDGTPPTEIVMRNIVGWRWLRAE